MTRRIKVLSALILILVFVALGVSSAIAAEETIEIDMSKGSLVICQSQYSHNGEWYDRVENDVFVLSGVGADGTYVSISNDATAEIVLNGVTLTNSNGAAISSNSASTGDVTITIADGTTNTLTGGNGRAAISKSGYLDAEIGTLLIQGETLGIGVLNAYGSDGAAGIGGDNGEGTCNIIITGGNITAVGGSGAAGIGSGAYGTKADNIVINDGRIEATGGQYGAGIGGGRCGAVSNLSFNNGVVIATGGDRAAGIGGGGGSDDENAGTADKLTFSNGTITAVGGTDADDIGGGVGKTEASTTDVVITGGSLKATNIGGTPTNGTQRGNQAVSLVTIDNPEAQEVLVYLDSTFRYFWNARNHTAADESDTYLYAWLPSGESLRLNVAEEVGKLIINMADGDLVIYENTYTHGGVSYDYVTGTEFVLSGSTSQYNVTVAKDVSANITFSGLVIDQRTEDGVVGRPALYIEDDSTGDVRILVATATSNVLYGGYGAAAISKNGLGDTIGTLTIDNESVMNGTLEVYGGSGAAAIGGSEGKDTSNIVICGSDITAVGGYGAAAIGTDLNGELENITISDGTLHVIGGEGGAGIGGGAGSGITISGGAILAEGTLGGAGIGGNKGAVIEQIAISGGTITALGGDVESVEVYDIGAGYMETETEQTTGKVIISGGSVKADCIGPVVVNAEDLEVSSVTIANPYVMPVLVNGVEWSPMTHQALDEDDTNLYAWLSAEDEYYVTRELPQITAPTAKEGLIYTGSALTLISKGYTSGGTLKYSLDGANWSEELPTAVDAGEYTVYYMIEGDDKYEDVQDNSTMFVTVTIEGAVLEAPKGLSFIGETYYGKADGKINGLSTEMEYSTDDGDTWMDVTDTSMTFAAGEVWVRYALKKNYVSAEVTKGTIGEGVYFTITFEDVPGVKFVTDVTATQIAWNSNVTITIELEDEYMMGEDFTLYVDYAPVTMEGNTYTITNIRSDKYVYAEGVYDMSMPELIGLPEGVNVFYVTQKVSVTDNDLMLVQVDDEDYTEKPTDIILAGNVDTIYSIMAVDQSENGVIWEIVMKPIATIREPIDGLTTASVNSSHKETIAGVLEIAEGIDLTNATEEEIAEVQAIISEASEYMELLEEIEAAMNTEAIQAASLLNEDNVTVADKATIEQAIEDLEYVLATYSNDTTNNLTEAEKQAVEDEIVRLEALLTKLDEEVEDTITDAGRTLNLDGVIYINQYITVEGYEGIDVTKNGGLMIWTSEVTEAEAIYANAEIINAGMVAVNGRYVQATQGLTSVQYADELYLRVYLQLEDGTYVYGPLKEFSVQDYCEAIITKYEGQESALRDTCVALLHYGTAAQEYFGYNTGDLANKTIVADYPVAEWNEELLTPLDTFTSTIEATGDVTHVGKTLDLNSAIKINYYYEVDFEVDSSELLVWDGVTGTLTENNASYTVEFAEVNGRYAAASNDFSSVEYDKTIFACAKFVDTDGNVHYSDVAAFSPEAYAENRINNSSDVALVEVMKRMVTYGEYAKIYFESLSE